MYETIYLAQESKDEACIARALTLMHKLLLANSKGDIHSLYMVMAGLCTNMGINVFGSCCNDS